MPGDDPGTPGEDESGGAAPDESFGESGWGFDDVSMDPSPPPGTNPGGAEGDRGGTPLGVGEEGTGTPVSSGIGSLLGNVTPDSPDLATILTAPLESLISFFTFGLVDPEFTGKDVFGAPGASSSDF